MVNIPLNFFESLRPDVSDQARISFLHRSSEAVRLPATIAILIHFALGSKLRQAIQLSAPRYHDRWRLGAFCG